MNLHLSLSEYITNPKGYHLEMEGDTLKATSSNPIHPITRSNLEALKILAMTDELAKKVLVTLRTYAAPDGFSIAGLLMPILPERIFSSIFGAIPSDMEENLTSWCKEKIGTSEYEARSLARSKIRECFFNKSQVLDLTNSQITTLPESMGELISLQGLYLSCVPLTALPESIGGLISLKGLSLNSTRLTTLPESIGGLISLNELSLDSTSLTALPESIGDLSSLTYLSLAGTPLGILPESIGRLTSLTTLNLRKTSIAALSESVCNLSSLSAFDLTGTLITALPERIGELISLKELSISCNRLTALPESIGNLSNLRKLDLCYTRLTALPESIGNLFNLREFELFHTPLAALPESISNLSNLRTLNLSHIPLAALPESIGNLSNLRILSLRYTRITALPERIGNLSNLRELDLFASPIAALPASLARLPFSSQISAEGTHLSAPAIADFQAHISAIRVTNPELGPNFGFSIHDDRPVSVETPLETKITFWLDGFKKAFPTSTYVKLWETRTESHYPQHAAAGAGAEDPHLSFYKELLEHPQKELLNIFLRRLQDTKDFKGAAKSTLILQVEQMLSLAAVNKDFRDKVFLILEDALSSCGDRVTNALTEIEIQYRLYSIGDNPLNLASLLIGIARKDLLHGIAVKKIEELRLGDAIETILYYKLQLKEVLKLPITTEGMLYPSMSGIKAEDLVAAKDEVLAKTTSPDDIVKVLLQFDSWKEKVKTHFKEDLERFQGTFMERLASIPSTLSEGEQLEATKVLTKEYNTAVAGFVEARTNEWVSANLKSLLGL